LPFTAPAVARLGHADHAANQNLGSSNCGALSGRLRVLRRGNYLNILVLKSSEYRLSRLRRTTDIDYERRRT
jgi:hypothetical protein